MSAERLSLRAPDPRTSRRAVFSVVSSDPRACNLCDAPRETSKVCRLRRRQVQTQIDSARGRRASNPYFTAQLCDECRALITRGAHDLYDEAMLYSEIRPLGVTEAEAAAAIEAIREERPVYLVRFMDPGTTLSTMVKAGRALSPSGAVALRWVVDARGIITGVEIVDGRAASAYEASKLRAQLDVALVRGTRDE